MAIQKLEIDGYLSFQEVTWKPGKMNLLVGPNGSGKSNLLRTLRLISSAASGRLSQAISGSDGMWAVLWDQAVESLGWQLTLDGTGIFHDPERKAIAYELRLALFGGSGYFIATDTLRQHYAREGDQLPAGMIYHRDPHGSSVLDRESKRLVPLSTFETGESLLSQIGGIRGNPEVCAVKEVLEAWGIYYGIDVGSRSPMRMPAMTQYSSRVLWDGSNLAAVLHTLYEGHRGFKQEIDDGMRAAFGKEYVELVFPPAAAQMIQLGVQWNSSARPHVGQQLSDGTLQYLFLLTVLAHREPPPLIAIDEPETGLHPSMFPLVAEYAVAAAERTQVIITSHSPEFLDVFTEYEPCVTVCTWEDGRTHLSSLLSEKLQKWLERYRLGEMFTSGDLDVLALPDVDVDEKMEGRFNDLSPEGLPLPSEPESAEGAAHE